MNGKKRALRTDAAVSAGLFALSLAGGYIMCGTTVGGAASFADISLCGALPLPFSAAVFTGAIVRSILRRSVGRLIVKHVAMVFIVIAKMFFEERTDPRSCAGFTALSVFISGAAVSAVIGELLYKLPFYLFYAVISGITAYCVSSVIMSAKSRRAVDLTGVSGLYYAIVYTLYISTLCSAKIPAVDLGIVLGTAATLGGAYFYGSSGGVAVGALTVCGAFLSSAASGSVVVMLPAAGLIAGYFHERRAFIAAVIFTAVSFISVSVTGVTYGSTDAMLDILCGAGLFLLAAPVFTDKWVITGTTGEVCTPDIINTRSGFIADSLALVRSDSERIAQALTERSSRPTDIIENRRAVCDNCYRRAACWRTSRDETLRGFRTLSRLPEISRESFPYELADCLRRDELTEAFRRTSREKATAKLMSVKLAENRRSLYEQISVTEGIVAGAASDTELRRSAPTEHRVSSKLERAGYSPAKVIAWYNVANRLIIELYFPSHSAPETFTRICDLLSDELHTELVITGPDISGREVRVRIAEPPQYVLDVYAASTCAEDSPENGDTSAVFSDGIYDWAVLSDGMGTGRSAALQSRIVVRLFRQLISAGIGAEPAVRLINSVMLTKSREETFATLDAVRIDLDRCGLTVVKSGASATLIRHRGSVLKVTAPTFPVGITEHGETFISDYEIEDGDMVIMFSDGISENEYLFIKELLLRGDDDLRRIVSEICSKAETFDPNIRLDDVTVIGMKIHRRTQE